MIHIKAIPAFTDNYIWLLYPDNTHKSPGAWVVDPGDAEPVLAALSQHKLSLEGVFLTHHHGDHDGGIPQLKKQFPDLRVICGDHSDSPHGTEHYAADSLIKVLGCSWKVIDIPGHTLDHIAFYCAELDTLLCGDTLFAGGCGRIFEGTPAQMHQSLQKLAALPPQTKIYCAHEYTQANLAFAAAVEPSNTKLTERIKQVDTLRKQNLPSVPSILVDELATNPFLRSNQITIKNTAESYAQQSLQTELDVFTAVREWKNNF